jgi:hypothetical protein
MVNLIFKKIDFKKGNLKLFKMTDTKQCRICLSEDEQKDIIAPCDCKGSIQYVHKECLQKWVDVKHSLKCGLCKKKYDVKLKVNYHNDGTKAVLAFIFFCILNVGVILFPDYKNTKFTKLEIIVFGDKGSGKTTLIENMKKIFSKYGNKDYEINYIEKGDNIKVFHLFTISDTRQFFIHIKRFRSYNNKIRNNILIWNFDGASISHLGPSKFDNGKEIFVDHQNETPDFVANIKNIDFYDSLYESIYYKTKTFRGSVQYYIE